jgi:hypothetical protein
MEPTTNGLALEELEARSRAELLPDRIEMRHCRWRRGRRYCRPRWYHTATASAYFFGGSTASASATASATASALAATGGPTAAPIAGAAAAGLIASGLAALRLVARRDAS